jgi:hypothetical protein
LEKFRNYTANPNVGFDLALKVDNLSIVYGSTPSFTTTFNGLVASDLPASSLGGVATYTVKNSSNLTVIDVANANVGVYTVSVSWAGLPPYYVHKKKTGTLTITKKPIVITATNQTISEGDSAPTFGATFSGFEGSDDESDLTGDLSYIVKNSDGEVVADVSTAPIGTYSIIPTGLISANNRYHLNFVPGTLTIEV